MELIKVTNKNGKPLVSARELYTFLGLSSFQFVRWSGKNVRNNPFAEEGKDFQGYNIMLEGNNVIDYALSLDFAKRLCMLARTYKGEQARNYFIECEKKLKQGAVGFIKPKDELESLAIIIDRETKLLKAMKKIQQKEIALRESNVKVEQQTKLIGDLSPKAKVYDQVMDAKGEMSLRKVAAVLNIKDLGRNILFDFLRYIKILDKKNIPYRPYENAGYFRVIASTINIGTEDNVKLKEICITKVTTKGLAYITKRVDENYDNYLKEKGKTYGSKSKTKKTFKEESQAAGSSVMAT